MQMEYTLYVWALPCTKTIHLYSSFLIRVWSGLTFIAPFCSTRSLFTFVCVCFYELFNKLFRNTYKPSVLFIIKMKDDL